MKLKPFLWGQRAVGFVHVVRVAVLSFGCLPPAADAAILSPILRLFYLPHIFVDWVQECS